MMPPQERGVSFLRAWSPYRRNDEWVKEAEDLELSPLLLLAWSSVPHRATPRVRLWWPHLWTEHDGNDGKAGLAAFKIETGLAAFKIEEAEEWIKKM